MRALLVLMLGLTGCASEPTTPRPANPLDGRRCSTPGNASDVEQPTRSLQRSRTPRMLGHEERSPTDERCEQGDVQDVQKNARRDGRARFESGWPDVPHKDTPAYRTDIPW